MLSLEPAVVIYIPLAAAASGMIYCIDRPEGTVIGFVICKSFVGAKLGTQYPVLLQLTAQGPNLMTGQNL